VLADHSAVATVAAMSNVARADLRHPIASRIANAA
jgi:hypothetical protein